MKTPYFTQPEYNTPENTSQKFLTKLFLATQWYFFTKCFAIITQAYIEIKKGTYNYDKWIEYSHKIFKLVEECGGKISISGLENIKLCNPPVVFISNHMSTLETLILPCIIGGRIKITFVVKKSLIYYPIFGALLKKINPIVVDRNNPRKDFEIVLSEGKKFLSEGISIVIFPQKTRTLKFVPSEFNTLGIKLSKIAKVPIVPIALKTDFWTPGKIIKDLGTIHKNKKVYIKFGPPLVIKDTGKQEHQKIIEFISTNLTKWKMLEK